MKKLYRYRPMSPFLFKELYYQELYFASYAELNDPLDLSARIDFSPREFKHIGGLLWFLYYATLKLDRAGIPPDAHDNNQKMLRFMHDSVLADAFQDTIFEQLTALSKDKKFISVGDVLTIIKAASADLPFQFDILKFTQEIKRLAKKFLQNSSVTCFSETNTNPLLWSHYSSSHSGICLEFTLEREGMFPYRMPMNRQPDKEKYLQRLSHWQVEEHIFWEPLSKVTYQDEQPFINFFDFVPAFANEHDADLLGLSKTWAHGFAWELKFAFATKTRHWAYENEWRAISIHFGDQEYPEERIKHFPIECLSAIYFGLKTPADVKKRIYNIFKKHLHHEMEYYECVEVSGDDFDFKEWEYECD